jgi:hypothetical protein
MLIIVCVLILPYIEHAGPCEQVAVTIVLNALLKRRTITPITAAIPIIR